MSRSLKAHILLILVTLVWGATFVQIKNALQDISPLLFNAVRMALAAVVLAAIYLPHLRSINSAVFRSGVLVGVFLWLGYEFQTTGLKLTTASKSAFLTSLSVVLVPIFLTVFWRRKVSLWTAVGVVAAFTGLYLLTVPSGSGEDWLGNFRSVNRGDVLTMACAIAFTPLVRRHSARLCRVWPVRYITARNTRSASRSASATTARTPSSRRASA